MLPSAACYCGMTKEKQWLECRIREGSVNTQLPNVTVLESMCPPASLPKFVSNLALVKELLDSRAGCAKLWWAQRIQPGPRRAAGEGTSSQVSQTVVRQRGDTAWTPRMWCCAGLYFSALMLLLRCSAWLGQPCLAATASSQHIALTTLRNMV